MKSISTSDCQSRTETQRSSRMSKATQPELQKRNTDLSGREAETLWKEDTPSSNRPQRRGHLQKSLRALPRRRVQWTPSSAVFTSVNFAMVEVCKLRCTRLWYLNVVASFGVGALQVMGPPAARAFWCMVPPLCTLQVCVKPQKGNRRVGGRGLARRLGTKVLQTRPRIPFHFPLLCRVATATSATS